MEFDLKYVDLTLFEPTVADMRDDYPELKEFEEFKNLSSRDLRFIWFVANKTSPLVKDPNYKNQKKRIKAAVAKVYKNSLDTMKIDSLLKGQIDPIMARAMVVMTKFNPSARLLGRMSLEIIFERYQRLLMTKAEEIIDLEDKKKFAEMLKKVEEGLPRVIAQLEHGFGIKVTNRGEEVKILAKLSELE